MGDLKSGWTTVKLGQVVRQVKDKISHASAGAITHYVPGGGITQGDLRIREWQPVDDGVMGPAFHMRFRPGHTLYKSRVPHGVAVADRVGICANTTFVLEPSDDRLLPDLLPYLLVTDSFREFERDNDHGSTNLFLNFSDIVEYEFALPPLEEQRRIVAMFIASERLLHDFAASSDIADKLPDALMSDHLRQMFSADQPLRFRAPRPPHRLCRAGELLTARQGLQVAQAERSKEPAAGLQPYLTAQYMLHGGDIEYVRAPSARVVCSERDVLVLRTGMTNGTVFTGHAGAFHNNFFAVDCDERVLNRDYLVAYLRHPNVRHLMRTWSGATNIPDLNHGDFYAIPFPLPSLGVQQRVADRYNELKAAAHVARQRVDDARRLRSMVSQTLAGMA